MFNIFTSTDKKLRDKELDNLLRIYYDSLAKMVKVLGSNPDELFTYENLQEELKECGNIVPLLVPIYTQTAVADTSRLTDFSDNKEENKELITGLCESEQQEYDRRMNEVFEDIVRLGLYHKIN